MAIRSDHPWVGQTVVFTGASRYAVGGVALDRGTAEELARRAGMQTHPRLTKQVHLLVDCDPDQVTGKERKAAEYGVQVVCEEEFWRGLGIAVTPVEADAAPAGRLPQITVETPSSGLEIRVGVGPAYGQRSRRPPIELSPADAAGLQPARLDPAWPVLPRRPQASEFDSRADYVPVGERPYNRTTCPHCEAALQPLPKAKKKCPTCGHEIFVRSGPDGLRYLLTPAEVHSMQQRWAEEQHAAWVEADARFEAANEGYERTLNQVGILTGDSGPEVVGESHHLRELAGLMLALKGGPSGGEVRVAAELVREPTNKYDKNAVAVVVHGLVVGYIDRYEAEEYQDFLMAVERSGKRAFVEATLAGGRRTPAGGIGPIGVEIVGMPDPY